MGEFLTLLNKFLRSRLTIGSIARILGIFALSSGTALSIVYTNYYNYWERTIYRTQTVDFNILANYLPTKLSIYLSKPRLSQQDLDDLQQALDSNYGLFGIIVTDCKTSGVDCPGQKILYASRARVIEMPNGQQRLTSNGSFSRAWLEKFEKQDFSNNLLTDSPFVILRDPPPLTQEWGFKTPRNDTKIYFTKQKNIGKIIGRAYLLRGEKPSLKQEMEKWGEEILESLESLSSHNKEKRLSSRALVYNSVALAAIVSGFIVFFLMEFGYYRARVALENEAKAIKDKLKAEQQLSYAIEKGRKAIQENREAEEAARAAVERSEQAIRERQEAEEAARAAVERSEQAIQERQEAEEAARAAVERSEQAIQERQEAEKAARVAEQDREQVRKQADDLYNSIEEAIKVRTRELQEQIDNLQRENDQIEVRTRKLQEQIGNLQRENDRLRSDNHDLAENRSLTTQADILALNMTEHDFYFRERQSLLIDILKNSLNNVNENSRRQHLLQDIIKNNLPEDETDDEREEMKTNIQVLFQAYRRMDAKTRRSLERLGFEIISENTHYKLRFKGDNRYVVILAKTPSDRRAGMNIARDICNLIF